MSRNATKLGDVTVGKVAVRHAIQLLAPLFSQFYTRRLARHLQHGLMTMTWNPTPVPDEDAFAAIKAGIDALPPGVKMILNSGGCTFRAPSF